MRGLGRVSSVADIEGLVVAMHDEVPITVGQLARVQIGATLKRGEGSPNAGAGVVIGVL